MLLLTILLMMMTAGQARQTLSSLPPPLKHNDLYNITSDYNPEDLPPSDGPLLVTASWNLRSIMDINEAEQSLRLDATFRFSWRDTRIKGNPKNDDEDYVMINPDLSKISEKIWMPDVFIDQAKEIHTRNLHLTPSSIRIYPDGTIRYAARKTFDVACMMHFHQFPMDAHVCHLIIHSFAYTTDHYQLKYNMSLNYEDPDINPPQFSITYSFDDDYDMKEYEEDQPGLIFKIHLERKLTSHIMQEVIPSFLLVITAYGSLFLPPVSLNARGSMALITLLNIFTLNEGIRKTIPKVAYITYLDIWLEGSFILIFMVNFEFIWVLCLITIGKVKSAQNLEKRTKLVVPSVITIFTVIYFVVVGVKSFTATDA